MATYEVLYSFRLEWFKKKKIENDLFLSVLILTFYLILYSWTNGEKLKNQVIHSYDHGG